MGGKKRNRNIGMSLSASIKKKLGQSDMHREWSWLLLTRERKGGTAILYWSTRQWQLKRIQFQLSNKSTTTTATNQKERKKRRCFFYRVWAAGGGWMSFKKLFRNSVFDKSKKLEFDEMGLSPTRSNRTSATHTHFNILSLWKCKTKPHWIF